MKENKLYLWISNKTLIILIFLLLINESQLSFADINSDPKSNIHPDESNYGGIGDIKSVSILTNNTHIIFQVDYKDAIINSTNYLRLGDIFLDIDQNRSTGYKKYRMGSDYRIDFDIFGYDIRGLADIAYWNSSRFAFIEVYPVKWEATKNQISIYVPLDKIHINNQTIFNFRTAYRTRIIDRVFNSSNYILDGQSNQIIDGNLDDWIGISPIFTEEDEPFDDQSDFVSLYVADNSTHLFHRFTVKGDMPKITDDDVTLGGEFRLYYDVDDNISTGQFRNTIGADIQVWINTQRNSSGTQIQNYGYLHRWSEENNTWDWNNKETFNSVFVNSTFEFSIPISSEYLNITNGSFDIEVAQYNADTYDNIPNELSITYIPPFINIFESQVNDNRVDYDAVQYIFLHAILSNGNNVSSGIVYVNNTAYEVNNSGWVPVEVSSGEVKRVIWTVTGVNILDIKNYDQIIENPSIIWDYVNISVPEGRRINPGEEMPNGYAHYSYDGLAFNGSLTLNDTIADKGIGKYMFEVINVNDPEYNLSAFDSDPFSLIIDKAIIELIISDDHVDVGFEPYVVVSSVYQSDNAPFNGNVSVNYPDTVFSIKDHTYRVNNITDEFGITGFHSNNVTVVWDQLIIDGAGVSEKESNIGESQEIWFTARYAYNDEIFDGNEGVLYVNWEPCIWDEQNLRWVKTVSSDVNGVKTYFVTKIDERKYDLTLFHQEVGDITITWKTPLVKLLGLPYSLVIIALIPTGALLYYRSRKNIPALKKNK